MGLVLLLYTGFLKFLQRQSIFSRLYWILWNKLVQRFKRVADRTASDVSNRPTDAESPKTSLWAKSSYLWNLVAGYSCLIFLLVHTVIMSVTTWQLRSSVSRRDASRRKHSDLNLHPGPISTGLPTPRQHPNLDTASADCDRIRGHGLCLRA